MSTAFCSLNSIGKYSPLLIVGTSFLGITLVAFGVLGISQQGMTSPEVWRIIMIGSISFGIIFLDIFLFITTVRNSILIQKKAPDSTPTQPANTGVEQENDSLPPFDLIPTEILSLIFSFLDPIALANCSCVSNKFHASAEDTHLWEEKAKQIEGIHPFPKKISPWKVFFLEQSFYGGPHRNLIHKDPVWKKIFQTKYKHTGYVNIHCFGDLLYSCYINQIYVFNLKEKKFIECINTPCHGVATFQFIDKDNVIIMSRQDNKLFLWNIKKKRKEWEIALQLPPGEGARNKVFASFFNSQTLIPRNYPFKSIKYSENWDFKKHVVDPLVQKISNYLLIGKPTPRIIRHNYIFDFAGKYLFKIKGNYRADNGTLALIENETQLDLWNLETRETIGSFPIPQEVNTYVHRVKMNSDYLALAYDSRRIMIWNLHDQKVAYRFEVDFEIGTLEMKHDYIYISAEIGSKTQREVHVISAQKRIYTDKDDFTRDLWLQPNLMLFEEMEGDFYIKNIFTDQVLKRWHKVAGECNVVYNITFKNHMLIVSCEDSNLHILDFS